MKVNTLIAVLFMTMLAPATALADEFTREDAEDMVFDSLSQDDRATVVKHLETMSEESVETAEESIREEGGLVPFAYVSNPEGDGNYIMFDPEQQVPADAAARTIQRSILSGAIQGNLVASVLYMTVPAPQGLDDETRREVDDSLPDDVSFRDIRFLMIEMQHLAGVGILNVVPYWQQDGEWVFGATQTQQIPAELHGLVARTINRAAEEGASPSELPLEEEAEAPLPAE